MAVVSQTLPLIAVTRTRVDAFSWTWPGNVVKLGVDGEQRLFRF